MNQKTNKTEDLGTRVLDDATLSARARNTIERLWGKSAVRRDLVANDAYLRLTQARRVGPRTLAEIERAVLDWGLPGIGGKDDVDPRRRRAAEHRTRLDSALQDLGLQGVLSALSELCTEHVAGARQGLSLRLSRLRRQRYEREVAYYSSCANFLRRCLGDAPLDP